MEARAKDMIDGVLRRRLDLVSGRLALVEDSLEFTLVPWRPILERQLGKRLSSLMRASCLNWPLDRELSGPTIFPPRLEPQKNKSRDFAQCGW